MGANSLTWTWDDFSGGEADGFRNGPQGSVRVTENVDTRSFDGGVTLAKKSTSDYAYLGSVTAVSDVYTLSYTSSPAFAAKDGSTVRVYSNNASTSFTMGDSLPAYNEILAFAGMWSLKPGGEGFFPFAISNTNGGVGHLHKLTADYSGASYGIASFTLPNGRTTALKSAHAVSVANGSIIFAAGNGIWELSNTETLSLRISLPADCDIVGLTKFQDSYRVYFNQGVTDTKKDGFVAYWTFDSDFLSQIAQYDNTEILSVIQGDAYDYVTVGNENYATLYAVGGLKFEEIRTTVGSSTANSRGFTKGGISEEGKLSIPGKNKNGNYCVYEYGNEYRGQPLSLSSGITSSSLCGSNKKISHVTVNGTTKYVYVDNAVSAGNSKFYVIPLNNFDALAVNEGQIVTLPFLGIGPHTRKKLERVRVGYSLLGNSNTIEIYARINATSKTANSSGWVLIGTCNDNSRNSLVLTSSIINASLGGFFQSLEFKAVLKSSNSDSPSLESIEIEYTDNLEN